MSFTTDQEIQNIYEIDALQLVVVAAQSRQQARQRPQQQAHQNNTLSAPWIQAMFNSFVNLATRLKALHANLQQENDEMVRVARQQIDEQLQQSVAKIAAEKAAAERRIARAQEEQENLTKLAETIKEKFIKRSISLSSEQDKVKLNIGGQIFVTTRDTLLKPELPTFFSALLSGNFNTLSDKDGEIFIDRCPKYFPLILNHLRGIDVTKELAALPAAEKELATQEFRYYLVTPPPQPKGSVRVVPTWQQSKSHKLTLNNYSSTTYFARESFDANSGTRVEISIRVFGKYDSVKTMPNDFCVGIARNSSMSMPIDSIPPTQWHMTTRGLALRDIITIILPGDGTLEFAVNGVNLGCAFDNIQGNVCPFVYVDENYKQPHIVVFL